ncbi:hypothetical protein RIF29_18735 [Crotalaria pallida]|uniref:Uncharacterized protein n=1 Tax=Crotalaria pallida TaxID=3830 RepID=A0AAN9I731_CROPI
MWNYLWKWIRRDSQPPPPPPKMVIVPPLFDFPPIAARTRMLESSYNVLFGKLALKCLFDDYYQDARHFTTRIMLKPIDDPNVDLIATVSGPLDNKPEENIIGNALFRWQRILQMRSCAYYPKYGFGAFGVFPLISKKRESSEDYGLMGLRYGSANLSVGVTLMPPALMPFAMKEDLPKSAWLVSKMGRLTAGVQYEPQRGNEKLSNLMNWSCAMAYGVGSGSPLSPSFNFSLELAKSSQNVIGGVIIYTLVLSSGLVSYVTCKVKCMDAPNCCSNLYQRADPNFVMLTPSKEHLAEGIAWETGKRPMLQSDIDAGHFEGLPRELRPLDKIL